jgi:hypothetical protein
MPYQCVAGRGIGGGREPFAQILRRFELLEGAASQRRWRRAPDDGERNVVYFNGSSWDCGNIQQLSQIREMMMLLSHYSATEERRKPVLWKISSP